jgi:hypothetical protein
MKLKLILTQQKVYSFEFLIKKMKKNTYFREKKQVVQLLKHVVNNQNKTNHWLTHFIFKKTAFCDLGN